MMYSATHKAFIITQKDLDMAACLILCAMKSARKIANVTMGKRKLEGSLEPIDHCEKNMIEAARSIGIEFGTNWGNEIDLTDIK